MPVVGDTLGGKYRLLAKVGEGGMGVVFRAENLRTGKLVAIKWMHPHIAARTDAVARLLREAQVASRVDHPNIVDVYDVVDDEDSVFMVMELLQGETLSAYLEREQPRNIPEFLSHLMAAMDAVALAHENGVIHRDLKPDNIFLVRSRSGDNVTVKVLDFGVAKVATPRGLTLTATGAAIGTPVYMSMEQLRGDRDIDARTDVYAFGAIIYEGISGEVPFPAETLHELIYKITSTSPVPLKERCPTLPDALASLIERSLAREREQRVANLREFIAALEPFAQGDSSQGTSQRALSPTLPTAEAALLDSQTPETLLPRVLHSPPARSSRPLFAWLLTASGLAATVAGLSWVFHVASSDARDAGANAPEHIVAPRDSKSISPAVAQHAPEVPAQAEPELPAALLPTSTAKATTSLSDSVKFTEVKHAEPKHINTGKLQRPATPPPTAAVTTVAATESRTPPPDTASSALRADDTTVSQLSTPAPGLVASPKSPSTKTAAAGSRFVISNGMVRDTQRGLIWQRLVPKVYLGCSAKNAQSQGPTGEVCTWSEAKRYCAYLNLGGGGWRLPTQNELHTLVEDTQGSPPIDISTFPNTPRQDFWTANTASAEHEAAVISFADGSAHLRPTTSSARVRCIRHWNSLRRGR